MKKTVAILASLLLAFTCMIPMNVDAKDKDALKYYVSDESYSVSDKGYVNPQRISQDDPHFGWKLGRFVVQGHTRVVEDDHGVPIFLKNTKDEVDLKFELNQNINELNGDPLVTIYDQAKGFDETFGVNQMKFGKGMLLIQHTNFENNKGEVIKHDNFLEKTQLKQTDSIVALKEEGDYEVLLDYCIMEKSDNIALSWRKKYTYYQIPVKFKVRNGNCMFALFDKKSGSEIANTSKCEEGFVLDNINSHYLDINVKREVMNNGRDGLVEDVRFNRPAKPKEVFDKEGVYTIKAKNRYTQDEVEKKVYVGNDEVLISYVKTGQSIDDIRSFIEQGATIDENGNIIFEEPDMVVVTDDKGEVEEIHIRQEDEVVEPEQPKHYGWFVAIAVIAIVGFVVSKNETLKSKLFGAFKKKEEPKELIDCDYEVKEPKQIDEPKDEETKKDSDGKEDDSNEDHKDEKPQLGDE